MTNKRNESVSAQVYLYACFLLCTAPISDLRDKKETFVTENSAELVDLMFEDL